MRMTTRRHILDDYYSSYFILFDYSRLLFLSSLEFSLIISYYYYFFFFFSFRFSKKLLEQKGNRIRERRQQKVVEKERGRNK